MIEPVAPAAQLETLKRKRAHRRGQITRIQRRLAGLQDKQLKNIPVPDIEQAQTDLHHEIEIHETLHDQIKDLLATDEHALEVKQMERETRDDIHSSLLRQLSTL